MASVDALCGLEFTGTAEWSVSRKDETQSPRPSSHSRHPEPDGPAADKEDWPVWRLLSHEERHRDAGEQSDGGGDEKTAEDIKKRIMKFCVKVLMLHQGGELSDDDFEGIVKFFRKMYISNYSGKVRLVYRHYGGNR